MQAQRETEYYTIIHFLNLLSVLAHGSGMPLELLAGTLQNIVQNETLTGFKALLLPAPPSHLAF